MLAVSLSGASTCQFFSEPEVPGIDGKVSCSGRKVVRHGSVPASVGHRSIDIEVVATGTAGIQTKELTLQEGTAPPLPNPEKVVFQQSGRGLATSRLFGIPRNAIWQVNWAYNCGSLPGDFTFFVYSSPSNSPDLSDNGPTDLNPSGSGSVAYGDAGTFYFQIPTACAWSISVEYLSLNSPASPMIAPSATLTVKTPAVSESGGTVTLVATTHDATSCTFITFPRIPGIDGRASCSSGHAVRTGPLGPSSTVQSYDAIVIAENARGLDVASNSVLQRSPQTLLTYSGTGSWLSDTSSRVTTSKFTIPPTDRQWTLTTTYDCTANPAGVGLMIIDVDGTPTTDTDDFTPTGSGTNTATFTDSGTFYLSIGAECNWTVQVVG